MKAAVADDMASASSNTHLLLATQAYGMGVDAPDIRRVVHAGAPTTLEGNYDYRPGLSINMLLIAPWVTNFNEKSFFFFIQE